MIFYGFFNDFLGSIWGGRPKWKIGSFMLLSIEFVPLCQDNWQQKLRILSGNCSLIPTTF
jgi:hypothetical protein